MNPQRQQLGARLREVRATRYPSGNAFARAIGWAQSRVSKLETGAQLPTEEDLRAWATACGSDEDVVEQLLGMLGTVRIEYVNARDVHRAGGLADRQAHLGSLEQQATRLCEWQPCLVPGFVQTPDYAREVLMLPGGPQSSGASEADIDALVAERIRRQNVLYQRGKYITLIIGEGALYSPPGSRETLRAQLDRLAVVAGLSTLQLAVLPLRTPMPALPMGGFALHDDAVVLVETLTAETRLDQPDEVAVYRACFDRMLASSATGDDAVAIIRRAADDVAGPATACDSP